MRNRIKTHDFSDTPENWGVGVEEIFPRLYLLYSTAMCLSLGDLAPKSQVYKA
jgi:hypothetical protein